MSRLMLYRCVLVLIAATCFATGADAQSPGSVDPTWPVLFQDYAPPGQRSWLTSAPQPSGKLLVVGNNVGNNGSVYHAIWRYCPDGQLDPSFASGGTFVAPPATRFKTLDIDATGRIYAFGETFSTREVNGRSLQEFTLSITRLLVDGTLDASFGDAGIIRILVTARYGAAPEYDETWFEQRYSGIGVPDTLGLQPDGKILMIWKAQEKGSQDPETVLLGMRLLENGQQDTSFGENGINTLAHFDYYPTISITEVMNDGGFVVGISDSGAVSGSMRAARFMKWTAEGAVDTSFGQGGVISAPDAVLRGLTLQSDGKLLINGSINGNHLIVRLNGNGTLDPAFGNNGYTALPKAINRVTLEPGGGILGVSTVLNTSGNEAPALTRLTPNGQVDTAFVQADIADEYIDSGPHVTQGAYVITGTYEPNSIWRRHSIRRFMLEPWPRSGSFSTGQTPSGSGFHIEAHNMSGKMIDTATPAHVIGVHGYIFPESTDLNANADIFVVSTTPNGLFMRNTAGAFVPWSGIMSELVPAFEDMQLGAATYVPIHAGVLPVSGPYSFYVGYMRDAGPLIYIKQPNAIKITQ